MNGRQRRVLVLDPRNAYGSLIGPFERQRGLKVERAYEAAGAIRMLASGDFDGVIVDAHSPGARGGLVATLRACAPAARILLLVSRRIEELPMEHEEGIYYCQVLKPTG